VELFIYLCSLFQVLFGIRKINFQTVHSLVRFLQLSFQPVHMLNFLIKKLLGIAKLHFDDIKGLSDCLVAVESLLLVFGDCI